MRYFYNILLKNKRTVYSIKISVNQKLTNTSDLTYQRVVSWIDGIFYSSEIVCRIKSSKI